MLSEYFTWEQQQKCFTFTTDVMQTIFLYAFYANFHEAPGTEKKKKKKTSERKEEKRENFKLLCDERVPRNIVYAITISIMKHQPLRNGPEGGSRGKKFSNRFGTGEGNEIKKNSMSFIANKYRRFCYSCCCCCCRCYFLGSSGVSLPVKDGESFLLSSFFHKYLDCNSVVLTFATFLIK